MMQLFSQVVRNALMAALAIVVGAAGNSAWAQLPFFPGAEGYGGSWSGTPATPDGKWLSTATVYRVTNLNDSGAGSFRGAFQENSTNKIIIFDVAGTINLTSDNLDIKNLSNYYIAGQTAPGPVTVYGDMVQLTHSSGKENRNVVLRYMNFRKGTADNADSITFAGSGLGTNMILDHVGGSWSEDEILSVANNNTNVTVQYSMIHDALVSGHAYGSLIRPRINSQVSFHHNLYAHNASRQARFGTYDGMTLTADFRNNVIYNFRDRASYTGGSSESEQETTHVNYVGNYIIAGPGTTGPANIAYSVDKNVDTFVYQSGNYIDPDKDALLDGSDTGWGMFTVNAPVTDQTLTQMGSPFATPAVTTQTAPDAYEQIVDHVGNWWWNRAADPISNRVIGNLTNFTGVPIGAAAPIASELNSLLAAPMISHPGGYDADNDGMADTWETEHGGNLVWNADFDNDGYINLIEFINEKGEFPCPAPIDYVGPTSGTTARYAQIEHWKTNDGGVTAGSFWQPSKYDLARIQSGTVRVDAVGQRAGTLQVAPGSSNATLNVLSGWIKVTDELNVGSGTGTGTLIVAANGDVYADTVAIESNGRLQGLGDIIGDAWNDGLVTPGVAATPVGTLSINGDFMQTSGGILRMEINSAASYDQLNMTGTFFADGELDIVLNYSPLAGDTFDLLDFFDAEGGLFFDPPALSPGLEWDTANLFIDGSLSVVAAAVVEDADFNDDDIVDGKDFLIWQIGYNAAGGLAEGDADGSGFVDADDLVIWETQYGTSGGELMGSIAVPEPASLVFVVWGVLATSAFRRKR